MNPMLAVDHLNVSYGPVVAVDDVSFTVDRGVGVALVGESGGGKSTIVAAVLGLLPRSAYRAGAVTVAGTAAYVPQDTGAALNPVVAVIDQVAEVYRVHRGMNRSDARLEAKARLAELEVDPAVANRRLLPDELSGGMRQRSLLAIALALEADLIVADEPTSALDPVTAVGVLEALDGLRAATGAALLLVTHDLGVASRHADQVLVLEAGSVVERGETARVLRRPEHACTRRLVAAVPRLPRSDE
jgi:peptide/nickel transport system ATP-binding protein